MVLPVFFSSSSAGSIGYEVCHGSRTGLSYIVSWYRFCQIFWGQEICPILRIMGSQVPGGLEIQKNPASYRVIHPSFLEGPIADS